MSCRAHSEDDQLDLERDVPTTAADVAALRRLRYEAASWLSLTASQLQAILPPGALRDRPPIRHDARPFTLP
jgi:hypothetical protein